MTGARCRPARLKRLDRRTGGGRSGKPAEQRASSALLVGENYSVAIKEAIKEEFCDLVQVADFGRRRESTADYAQRHP
jgi:hypothetical protein